MKTILQKIIYCFIIGVNVSVSSFPQKTTSNIHWGFLIDENEGITKIYFNKHINQMCREKTEDIFINGTSISKGKVYFCLLYTSAAPRENGAALLVYISWFWKFGVRLLCTWRKIIIFAGIVHALLRFGWANINH